MINKRTIKSNSFVQSLIKFSNSNFVAKIIIALSIWIIASIPADLYFLGRWLIEPTSFWQEFAIFCIFAIGIGWLQIGLIIIACVLTAFLIFDDM